MARPTKYAAPEEKREAARLRTAKWRAENRERSNQISSEWGRANAERRRANYANRREHYAEMSRIRNERFRAKCKAERQELVLLREQLGHHI